MKRKTPLPEQVYKVLYPNGQEKPEDPKDWSAFVRRDLLREIRFEAKAFYGDDLGTTVLQPGLDYAYLPHRRRLGRFHHHMRLFAAMDLLGLTAWEIYNLCCWENSAYARDRAQEKRPGEKIDDDTGDDIPTWDLVQAQRRQTRARTHGSSSQSSDQHPWAEADEELDNLDEEPDMYVCALPADDGTGIADHGLDQHSQLPQMVTTMPSPAQMQRQGSLQPATGAAALTSSFRWPLQQSAVALA